MKKNKRLVDCRPAAGSAPQTKKPDTGLSGDGNARGISRQQRCANTAHFSVGFREEFNLIFSPPQFQKSYKREHIIIKWILRITHMNKDGEVDFADWLQDGKVLSK